MKKQAILSLAGLLFCVNMYAQDCDCSEALNVALMTNNSTFNSNEAKQFFYNYFKATEKERKQMKKDNSSSWGLDAVIKNIPFKFDQSSSSSKNNDYLKTIEQEVLQTGVFSDNHLLILTTSFLSTNQLTAYETCLKTKCSKPNGVFINIGGNVEDKFFVHVTFTNTVGMPFISLANDASYVGCYPINGLTLGKSMQIKNGQSVTQFFQRKDINETVSISLDFGDAITVQPITIEAKSKSNHLLPLGTIIASPLEPAKFLKQNGVSDISNISKNTWAPCDGSVISGSKYSTEFLLNSTPDLRGQFLRGFNVMLSSGTPGNHPNGLNPDENNNKTQSGYSYQEDAFQGHKHFSEKKVTFGNVLNTDWDREVSNGASETEESEGKFKYSDKYGNPRLSSETRPKNMSVYYYIKIN